MARAASRPAFRWAFAGCKPQGVQVLDALCAAGLPPAFCAAPPSLPRDDEKAIEDVVRAHGLTLHRSLKLQGFEEQLGGLDLLLTCRFEVLPPAVFEAPHLGAVNIHSSLLPKYRGVHPVSWALINGETQTGVTLHGITAGVDTGPVLAQRKVPIRDDDDLWSLTGRIDAASADEAVALMSGIARTGRLPPGHPQRGVASHAPRRTPDDGRINWSCPARAIFNLVRALPAPLPGAFCFAGDGSRVVFSRAEPGAAKSGLRAAPGTVLGVPGDGRAEIMCGDGRSLLAVSSAILRVGDLLS